MKAFEEWFEEATKELPDVAFQPCDGWKAALEWLLKQLDYSTEHEEIKDKIIEELD